MSDGVTIDRWFTEWLQPVRRVAVGGAFVVTAAFVPNTSPETTTVDRYHTQFSDPIRRVASLAHLQPFDSGNPWGLTQKEAVSVDRWHTPFSDPIRRVASTAYIQQFQFLDPASAFHPPPPEIIYPDKWFVEWQQPRALPLTQSGLSRFFFSHTPEPLATLYQYDSGTMNAGPWSASGYMAPDVVATQGKFT